MKKKIRRYKVSPDESLCLAVSVVDKPAVETDFIYLSKQKIEKFVGVDGERRMIYGCALRPDFPIYRNNGEEEYYLEFDKEAIDKISKNYFKMGFQSNWTAAHKDEVEGLTVTESWIKESMTMDKSIVVGLDADLPIGSWFIGCHCENDEIWNKVKQGTYHGFSIEAVVGVEEFEKQVEEINDNKGSEIMNFNEESFWAKLKSVLAEAFGKEEKEEEVKLEEQPETPQNEPTVEPQEPPKVEEPIETKVEEKEEPVVETPEEPKEEPKNDNAHLEELINNLKDEIAALKEMNSGLQDKIKDLGKKPSAKPVNTNVKPSGSATGTTSTTYQAWREQMRKYME